MLPLVILMLPLSVLALVLLLMFAFLWEVFTSRIEPNTTSQESVDSPH